MRMSQRVLLSPVGDTDPVRSQYDGPLLHIVRHYRPEKVYLFLTAEMERRSRADNRYEKCVHWVCPECQVEKIGSGIEAAHDFDQYSGVFAEVLDRIRSEHPEAEILLNISSATPQIQLAICLEAALGRYRCRAIQVATPVRKSNRDNRPEGQDFDVDLQMENNCDQQTPGEPNRCHEPDLYVVRRRYARERIVSLIRKYEYAGALAIAKLDAAVVSTEVVTLLEHAALRANLETAQAQKILSVMDGKDLFPVKDVRAKTLTEFFMLTRIRQERGSVADFSLKISPLLFGMICFFLEDVLKYRWKELTNEIEPNRFRLDRSRIEFAEPAFLAKLDENFRPYGFRSVDFSFYSAILLLEYLRDQRNFPVSEEILTKFQEMRHYEEKVRHLAAHQIIAVTEDSLHETAAKISKVNPRFRSRMTAQQLRRDIEILLMQILKGHGNQYRFIYEDINAFIEAKLG